MTLNGMKIGYESILWIIVPVFDRHEISVKFIRQILRQNFGEFRIVVIDHGTRPLDICGVDDSRIVVLRRSPNLWWTGAVNEGVKYVIAESKCDQDLVLIINDDVQFEHTYLQSLVRIAIDHPKMIIGSMCVYSDTGVIKNAGLSLHRLRARFVSHHAGRPPSEVSEPLLSTDVLPGRGMLVPLTVFARIGLFDQEHLPHYGADNEFSWRAKKQGFTLVVATKSVVATQRRRPRTAESTTTFLSFITDKRKSGNLPAVAAFASLCFSRPYAIYYTGVHFMRCTFSFLKGRLTKPKKEESEA